ncbi:MAG: peptide ABC transporter ATP-binding protein [Spirochaetae bacterium HGW-Spirochaetae-8]|jgi:peptide/nickel transport system ATP-binding protein|nr:MAG: peptide ABC transporter ATP-binding protein [Spirochaetae bacterium HGW-Spirochaetae-8]
MLPLVDVRNIKKHFKTPHGMLHAVDGVDLSIQSGKTLGVVGESGCGKSTLGRLVVNLIEATDGEVYFNNELISSKNKKDMKALRKEMQMIFQDPFSSLNPRMSVSELIADPLHVHERAIGRQVIDAKVEKLMESVGLSLKFKDSYPHELDGGRRQRIGIARALALNPRFIVCDEPVSALDVSIQAQILNLLKDFQRDLGLTYLFITHDLSVVRFISDEIMVMYLGKVMERCSAQELCQAYLHPYTKALFSAILVPTIHNKRERIILKGELSSPVNPKPGCRFAPRCPDAFTTCFIEEPKLAEFKPNHFIACHKFKKK